MIDIQDVRLNLLAIASATDCPLRAAFAHWIFSTERRGAVGTSACSRRT